MYMGLPEFYFILYLQTSRWPKCFFLCGFGIKPAKSAKFYFHKNFFFKVTFLRS